MIKKTNLITKSKSYTSLNSILITSSTYFEYANCSSSGGNFTLHAVYDMYHDENIKIV